MVTNVGCSVYRRRGNRSRYSRTIIRLCKVCVLAWDTVRREADGRSAESVVIYNVFHVVVGTTRDMA